MLEKNQMSFKEIAGETVPRSAGFPLIPEGYAKRVSFLSVHAMTILPCVAE
jgi:hypothetical protein